MSIEIVAEIGINHNGNIDTAVQMIKMAAEAGCDYVKFQKRTPEICVPDAMKDVMRETPWGMMRYIDYKERIEFSQNDYAFLDGVCRSVGIQWTASAWDAPSVEFLRAFDVPWIKIPSAKMTDENILDACYIGNCAVVIATGMSTIDELLSSRKMIYREKLHAVLHAVSAYPVEDADANLAAIRTLDEYGFKAGYSDHTRGIHMASAAAALGAVMIEKHVTLDRSMWGTDQAASIEPHALVKMVRNIRSIESGMGNGRIEVAKCEEEARCRLRG